eukprot:scaffold153228_cov35-Prasinocladus_malaysianus.AAC.1
MSSTGASMASTSSAWTREAPRYTHLCYESESNESFKRRPEGTTKLFKNNKLDVVQLLALGISIQRGRQASAHRPAQASDDSQSDDSGRVGPSYGRLHALATLLTQLLQSIRGKAARTMTSSCM